MNLNIESGALFGSTKQGGWRQRWREEKILTSRASWIHWSLLISRYHLHSSIWRGKPVSPFKSPTEDTRGVGDEATWWCCLAIKLISFLVAENFWLNYPGDSLYPMDGPGRKKATVELKDVKIWQWWCLTVSQIVSASLLEAVIQRQCFATLPGMV